MNQYYIYLGDKLTDEKYKDRICFAVKNSENKCIRGKYSTMLVCFNFDNSIVNVLARRLRKVKE